MVIFVGSICGGSFQSCAHTQVWEIWHDRLIPSGFKWTKENLCLFLNWSVTTLCWPVSTIQISPLPCLAAQNQNDYVNLNHWIDFCMLPTQLFCVIIVNTCTCVCKNDNHTLVTTCLKSLSVVPNTTFCRILLVQIHQWSRSGGALLFPYWPSMLNFRGMACLHRHRNVPLYPCCRTDLLKEFHMYYFGIFRIRMYCMVCSSESLVFWGPNVRWAILCELFFSIDCFKFSSEIHSCHLNPFCISSIVSIFLLHGHLMRSHSFQ